MTSAAINHTIPNPAIVIDTTKVGLHGMHFGVEGAIIPFVFVSFLLGWLADFYCWRELGSRWLIRKYGWYWSNKQRVREMNESQC
jgi:hypothetical protein